MTGEPKQPSGRTPMLLTGDGVCEMLATSRGTLRRLVASGDLPKVRIGGIVRYRFADVEALIERYAAENDEDPADTGSLATATGLRPRHDES